jgi:hypothetical protein
LAKKPPSDLQPVRTLPADLKLYVSQSEPSSPSPLPDKLVSTWLGHAVSHILLYCIQYISIPPFHELFQ